MENNTTCLEVPARQIIASKTPHPQHVEAIMLDGDECYLSQSERAQILGSIVVINTDSR